LERLVRVDVNESLGSTHGVLFLAALNTQQYSLKF
jgi:hypothetical protein